MLYIIISLASLTAGAYLHARFGAVVLNDLHESEQRVMDHVSAALANVSAKVDALNKDIAK